MKTVRWLAIVLLLLLLLGVWIASIFAPELRGVAQAVTATAVLLVVGFFVARWLRARLQAAAIEREMTKQKEPAADPRVAELQAKMQAAVNALKRRRPGAGRGRSSLYQLPWYVIVGPSAAGKSTALARSSLQFVSTDDGALKVRGNAGTRNCDWWLSPDAILLDTAGRFATEDNDRDEWLAFLDSLHRFRPERPLDGLLVAVSVPDVLSAATDQLDELAQKLRARLDEVLHRLEMVLPVYVLLTKSDLVAGFVEFFADLGKAQRSQVLGTSFEIDDPRLADPARAVEEEFDLLLDGMHARLLQRLPSERSPENRARILQFPVELRALRSPLATFIETLCLPHADQERPLLRGFYLTSGTQVGRPVDRVIAGMQRGFDLQGTSGFPNPPRGEEQSYFLSDVFRSVILHDRNLAARSAAGAQRRSTRELVFATVALAIATFLLVPAIVSYVRNTQIAEEVSVGARTVARVDGASVPGARLDPLEVLLDTLTRVDQEADGFGVAGWFGPRAARELRQPLWKAYIQRLDIGLRARLPAALDKRASEISKAVRRMDSPTGPPGERTALREDYDDIKLYVTLVDPAGHVDFTWTPKRLESMWHRTLAGIDTVSEERLLQHATEYLKALELDPNLVWTAPRNLQGARASLKLSNAWLLSFNWVLRHAFGVSGLVANDVIGPGQSIRYVACKPDEVVPGAYTKNGWRKIQPVLDSAGPWPPEAQIEPWVVADTRIPDDMEKVRQQVRDRYFEQYVLAWLHLLDECVVSKPSDSGVCSSELEALSGPTGFYESLFLQFKDNTIKYEKKETPVAFLTQGGCSGKMPWSQVDAAPPPETKSPVEKSFRPILAFAGVAAPEADAPKAEGPPPLLKYKQILQALMPLVATAGELKGSEVQAQLRTANRGLDGVLSSIEDVSIQKSMRALLKPPIEAAGHIITQEPVSSIADQWQKQVWTPLHALLERYPFTKAPNVRRDDAANFDAFAAFFAPANGTLGAFVAGPLAEYVTPGDGGPVAKPGYIVGDDLLSCLNVCQSIAEAFFPTGEERGTKVAVLVDWSAPDITDAKFAIGSKVIPLAKGDWSPSVKWAGEEVRLSYDQAGTSQQVIGRGSFSLFDLFDQLGGLKPTVGANYVASSTTLPLRVKLRSETRRDPFSADFFSRLHCPATIHPVPRP